MTVATIIGIVLGAGSLVALALLRRSVLAAALLAGGLVGITLQVIEQRRVERERVEKATVVSERCQDLARRVRSHANMVRESQADANVPKVAEHLRDSWLDLLAGAEAMWGVCVDLDCPHASGAKPDPAVIDKLAATLETGECRFR